MQLEVHLHQRLLHPAQMLLGAYWRHRTSSASRGDARTILEELQAQPATAPPTVSEVWLLGALGEIDAAFEVLARAEEGCQAFLYYTGLPAFDPLRADRRFAALLARLESDVLTEPRHDARRFPRRRRCSRAAGR